MILLVGGSANEPPFLNRGGEPLIIPKRTGPKAHSSAQEISDNFGKWFGVTYERVPFWWNGLCQLGVSHLVHNFREHLKSLTNHLSHLKEVGSPNIREVRDLEHLFSSG